MFNFFESKKPDVLSHWYALIPGFNTSTHEFYQSIEKQLKDRQVPGLEIARVEFAEGGILSSKREYLRMTRERLVFDICAAPFGTAYFFSCRFAEIPAVIRIWQLIILFFGFSSSVALAWKMAGVYLGSLLLLGALGLTAYVLRNAVAMGLKDLDASLVKSPVFGPIYELLIRKDSYYRQDTRIMYCDTVDDVVKELVEDVTGAKGIRHVQFNEHSPIFRDLYKPTTVQLPPTALAA
jgi:hypothetical protein